MSEKRGCSRQLLRGGYRPSPCQHSGVNFEDGKWWCKQHTPSVIRAKGKTWSAALAAKWAAKEQAQDRIEQRRLVTEQIISRASHHRGTDPELDALLRELEVIGA